jgi:hypothetical protein
MAIDRLSSGLSAKLSAQRSAAAETQTNIPAPGPARTKKGSVGIIYIYRLSTFHRASIYALEAALQ